MTSSDITLEYKEYRDLAEYVYEGVITTKGAYSNSYRRYFISSNEPITDGIRKLVHERCAMSLKELTDGQR